MIEPETVSGKDDRERMYAVRIPYRLPCKFGNWNEDLFIKEEKIAFETYKKDRCQLLLQKTRRMFRNLTKPTRLSHSLEILRYGENYQIMAPYATASHGTTLGARPVYLAGLITEKEIEESQKLSHGSHIVGCFNGIPCVRNTFRIIGCDRNKSGEPVNYGDDVYLQIVDDGETALFVQCENTFSQMGYHLKPILSQCPGTYCRFKMLHFNPRLRFEHEGSFVRANDRVVVQHVPTGRNLAVENAALTTFFGTERMISCHTFRDTHKMETTENIWKIVGENLPDINAMVRAAKGEQVPDDKIR